MAAHEPVRRRIATIRRSLDKWIRSGSRAGIRRAVVVRFLRGGDGVGVLEAVADDIETSPADWLRATYGT